MDPYQQPGPAPNAPQTQPPGEYDFINNPVKPGKKSLFGGGSDKRSMLIIIGGGIGLLTVILLIGSLFFGGDPDRKILIDVAQKQSEIIALASMGADDGGTNQTKSFGYTVQLSVTTEQQILVAHMTKKGKVKPKDIAAVVSPKLASELEDAQLNGRFDDAFAVAMKQELTEYQQELKAANAAVGSENAKELLAKDFDSATLLLSMPTN